MPARRRAVLGVGIVVFALVVAGCSGDSGSSDSGSSAQGATTTVTGGRRLIAPNGLRGVLDRERAANRRGSSSTTSSTTTTTTTLPGAPFPVAHTTFTFVDPSRGSPARGDAPATSSRTLVTTVYYPTSTPPTADAPTPPAAAGQYPLIVFVHGYEIDAAAYAPLLRDLAVGGFVVAAPDFPGTSTAHPGGANRADTLEQPADLSFVITSMLATADAPGPLQGAIDPLAIGDSGQSDGGVTALAAVANTCCIDPRIKAATILTGGAFGFEGDWFPPGTPPLMFIHATADEINPYGASTSMFEQAASPKYLLTVEGGSHLEVFVDPPWEPQIAQAMVAFYDLHLKGDATAQARLESVGNQPGLQSLQTG